VVESVYSAVRNYSLYKADYVQFLEGCIAVQHYSAWHKYTRPLCGWRGTRV